MSKMQMLPKRSIVSHVQKDLGKKMVFIGGPRQVGKTTLAQGLIPDYYDGHPAYLNWDLAEHRRLIKSKSWSHDEKLLVLDEIHKGKSWRNLLKGIYDTQKNTHSFLITGSARLNTLRKGRRFPTRSVSLLSTSSILSSRTW